MADAVAAHSRALLRSLSRAIAHHALYGVVQKEHYAHIADKPFFPKYLRHLQSGPVVAMVWEGKQAVENVRRAMGMKTNPAESDVGSVR